MSRPLSCAPMPSLTGPNLLPVRLFLLGLVSAGLYVSITWLSLFFSLDKVVTDRPLLTVLTLFGATFLAYLLACCDVWNSQKIDTTDQDVPQKQRSAKELLLLIVGFGILFRCIMLISVPIQEIDLYRYIVDGAVGNANVSPFEFAPLELTYTIDSAKSPQTDDGIDTGMFARSTEEQVQLKQLATQIASQPGLNTCVHRVHYGHFTSPYPPVSQAVFRLATAFVPHNASEQVWVLMMKITLTLFDVLTGFLLIGLLHHCRLPSIISLFYWWCPLLMKEIANSGHLDSIAICLTVGFAWLAVAALWPRGSESDRPSSFNLTLLSVGAAILLGLAVGAKVYPLVLAPVWTICLLRRRGVIVLLPVAVFLMVTAVCLWPIFQTTTLASKLNLVTVDKEADEALVKARMDTSLQPNEQIQRRPQAGIEMFSKYWEMNDLMFMVIVENVRPEQPEGKTAPWFLFTSKAWRTELAKSITEKYGLGTNEFAFSFTRMVTLAVYVVLTIVFCVLAWRANSASDMLSLFFLSIAWFWLLSPTQNPWYWLWALPLLPFVKRPTPWMLLSGMLFLYYLRFHFQNHLPNDIIWPTQYKGPMYFDFVVPWIEFLPVLVLLLIQTLLALRPEQSTTVGTPP